MNTTNRIQELRENDLEELVLHEYFNSEPNSKGIRENTVKSISKRLGISFYKVNRIINNSIKKKKAKKRCDFLQK